KLASSLNRKMKVAVAAVVKIPPTLSRRTAALCSPIAAAQTPRRTGMTVSSGLPPFANQITTKQRWASSETQRATVVRFGHTAAADCSPGCTAGCVEGATIFAARKTPTAKPAIDDRTD